MTLSGATAPGQSGPEEVLHIPKSSGITGISSSDWFMPYLGHSLEEYCPSTEMQSVYSIAPTDWADKSWKQHPTKQLLYGHLHLITQTILTSLVGWGCRIRRVVSWGSSPGVLRNVSYLFIAITPRCTNPKWGMTY